MIDETDVVPSLCLGVDGYTPSTVFYLSSNSVLELTTMMLLVVPIP